MRAGAGVARQQPCRLGGSDRLRQAAARHLVAGAAEPVPPAHRDPGEELEVLRRRRARERQHWDDCQDAFSEMLSNTSTHWAPWHVVPADRQWFARLAAAAAIANTLITIAPRYPVLDEDVRQDLLAARAELEAEGPKAKGSGKSR
ncbi:hypothetical protein [Kutzneria sp. 744]|uniref:hypothetical protein n=1 Tax=Kutzneria sp. (strain 744) TaxID=345341 RepID=UPI00350EE96C